jgi:hypothetical protein
MWLLLMLRRRTRRPPPSYAMSTLRTFRLNLIFASGALRRSRRTNAEESAICRGSVGSVSGPRSELDSGHTGRAWQSGDSLKFSANAHSPTRTPGAARYLQANCGAWSDAQFDNSERASLDPLEARSRAAASSRSFITAISSA